MGKTVFNIIRKEVIAKRDEEVAAAINEDYAGKEPVVVCVLNGALVFCADLFKKLTVGPTLDSVKVKTYDENNKSTKKPTLEKPVSFDVRGKDVIITEDILDEGCTLSFLVNYFEKLGARSVKTCVLLNKIREDGKKEIEADYVAFNISDVYVVGCGMDDNQKGRELPYVGGIIETEVTPEVETFINKARQDCESQIGTEVRVSHDCKAKELLFNSKKNYSQNG